MLHKKKKKKHFNSSFSGCNQRREQKFPLYFITTVSYIDCTLLYSNFFGTAATTVAEPHHVDEVLAPGGGK
jgi:hypothetical protein